MYLHHFGLGSNPFSLTPDPRFLFLTPKHREALAALFFSVTQRKGFMALTGDAGTGKTTLVRKLLLSIPSECAQFSVIVNPALNRSEFLECVLMDFGINDIPSSKARRLRLLNDLLLRASDQGKTSVLVIDEAHLLTAELIDEVRLLSNFETVEHKLLQILLAGQSELNALLDLESMRQVKQRLAIRMDIAPLSPSDVVRYVETRWKRAGGSLPVPFSSEAVSLIARASTGIPRIVNVLCDAALINAYGAGTRHIESQQIEDVMRDLHIAVPGPREVPAEARKADPLPMTVAARHENSGHMCSGIPSVDRYLPQTEKLPPLQRLASWFGANPRPR